MNRHRSALSLKHAETLLKQAVIFLKLRQNATEEGVKCFLRPLGKGRLQPNVFQPNIAVTVYAAAKGPLTVASIEKR